MKRFLIIACLIAGGLCGQPPEENARATRAQQEADAVILDTLLSKLTEVELVSIDPAPADKSAGRDNHILGRVTIKDQNLIAELRRSLVAGIRESDGRMLGCWDPRHQLRFTAGEKNVTITICFHCRHGYIDGLQNLTEIYMTRTPQAVFDRVFKGVGLKIAK
jgi:hypothetical protein